MQKRLLSLETVSVYVYEDGTAALYGGHLDLASRRMTSELLDQHTFDSTAPLTAEELLLVAACARVERRLSVQAELPW